MINKLGQQSSKLSLGSFSFQLKVVLLKQLLQDDLLMSKHGLQNMQVLTSKVVKTFEISLVVKAMESTLVIKALELSWNMVFNVGCNFLKCKLGHSRHGIFL